MPAEVTAPSVAQISRVFPRFVIPVSPTSFSDSCSPQSQLWRITFLDTFTLLPRVSLRTSGFDKYVTLRFYPFSCLGNATRRGVGVKAQGILFCPIASRCNLSIPSRRYFPSRHNSYWDVSSAPSQRDVSEVSRRASSVPCTGMQS